MWLRAKSTVAIVGVLALTGTRTVAQPAFDDFFESKIRPVLDARCYACHSSKLTAPKGELVLDTRDGVRKGGKQGKAIVPWCRTVLV